jgi:hypothetical protein
MRTLPHPLVCSDWELGQLQCPPLEAVITRERLRLASLHSLLFPGMVHQDRLRWRDAIDSAAIWHRSTRCFC